MENNNEILEETYSYQVNTRMPILGLSVGNLKVPTTVKLTKEDVLICVKKAPVFRRFSASDKERVGIGNIDRLHRAEHLTEEEYKALVDKENDNRGKVSETAPMTEEKKETPIVEETNENKTPVIEEIKEEQVVEESTSIIEETTETTNKVNEDEKVSEEVAESTENKDESVEENNKNNGYYNKKKHKR